MKRVLKTLVAVMMAAGLLPFCTQSVVAQQSQAFHYVANTRPPDAYLALRTHPTTRIGLQIATLPNGTLLEILERRGDGWWRVRVNPSGQEGWALSGTAGRTWIECCVRAPGAQATPADPELVGFRMPSGNVYCMLEPDLPNMPGGLRCDIADADGPMPPRPDDCDLDWGRAFVVSENGTSGERICHGDTVRDPRLPALAYGRLWRHGAFTCKSEPTGLTCINPLGHGFSLSRASQRLF